MSEHRHRRRPRRRRRALTVAGLLVALVVAAALVVGLRGRSDPDPAPVAAPTPSPSPDLSSLTVARAPFCGRLDAGDVRAALDAPVSGTDSYRSGERALVAPGVSDVSHELDCTFHAATGAEARVWVFAAPVTSPSATRLARDVRRARGCRPLTGAPAFGTPTASTLCPAPTPYGRQATLRGLFGDAWLSCQVSTAGTEPAAQVGSRAERWCTHVATALGTRP